MTGGEMITLEKSRFCWRDGHLTEFGLAGLA